MLSKLDWAVEVFHVFKKGNKAVNWLPTVVSRRLVICSFCKNYNLSLKISCILEEDCGGAILPRLISP